MNHTLSTPGCKDMDPAEQPCDDEDRCCWHSILPVVVQNGLYDDVGEEGGSEKIAAVQVYPMG